MPQPSVSALFDGISGGFPHGLELIVGSSPHVRVIRIKLSLSMALFGAGVWECIEFFDVTHLIPEGMTQCRP